MTNVFICDYIRTPFGRFTGALSSVRVDDLAALPLKEIVARNPHVDTKAIDNVILGCANQAGEDNRNVGRMAALLAGLPDVVPGATVNRLCGSGLDSILMAARSIKSGEADIVLAGGVESMSRAPFVMPKAHSAFSRKAEIYDTTIGWRFINPLMESQYGCEGMPMTAENVALQFSVSRGDQDKFAALSQSKAERAMKSGRLAKEIIPVTIPQRKKEDIVFSQDEHPRPGTSVEKLSKLPTPFKEGGTVTAGNASGINDGACALLIASEAAILKYNLSPMAKIIAGAHAGLEPRIMGYGPVPASEKLCKRHGLEIKDFDLFEINEAFAAQSLAVTRAFGLADDASYVNPNGGAIALGHPLGASGSRIAGTAALDISLGNAKRALVTMCIGVGQGVAMALEAV